MPIKPLVFFFWWFFFFCSDESPESPSSGSVSPKVTGLPPTLKKTLSEKEKEGQPSLQSGCSANKTTQEGTPQNWSFHFLLEGDWKNMMDPVSGFTL